MPGSLSDLASRFWALGLSFPVSIKRRRIGCFRYPSEFWSNGGGEARGEEKTQGQIEHGAGMARWPAQGRREAP